MILSFKYRLSFYAVLLTGLCGSSAADNKPKPDFLPAPYKFPETIDPWKRESALGIQAEKPRLTKKCKAELKLSLAPWLPVETEILTVILGRSPQYSPADKHRLIIPGHPEGSKNHLIALMDSKKVVFKATRDELKRICSFRSINYPGFTIRRSGANFIMSDFTRRLKYTFFSRDAGFSWFVNRISKIDNGNIGLRLIYNNNDKVTGIVMPDKKQFEIKYKNGLPVLITSPYGLINVLKWNDQSHITGIKTYLDPKHPLHPDFKNKEMKRKKPYLIRSIYKIEHDAEGNLVGMINSRGEKFSVEYRHDKDEKTKNQYWCAILTPPSGKTKYCSKKFTKENDTTLYEKGYVQILKDGTEEFNAFYTEKRRKKAKVRTFFEKTIRGIKYKFERDGATTAVTGVKVAGKTVKK